MPTLPCLLLPLLLALCSALPAPGDVADDAARQLSKDCLRDKSGAACLQLALQEDSYQVSEDVALVPTSRQEPPAPRGGRDLLDRVQGFLQSHDLLLSLPGDSSLRLSARGLADNQLDLSLRLGQQEGRRSKLRKIITPILVFVLLKAITLIPLFIGVLGLKAWNALQLSFFSFVISVALAIFQLCRKIAADAAQQPQMAAHGGWDSYAAARALDLAYRGHAP
ncbi:uncharacterized protein LOC134539523 [Bacillus rossius redtenbacheri]|uniref:uncharacterized protein LOC134539523 n=1 Tax=Bacillus rossius redtenbacheri TaxID=93214 RepID=UPI002FDDC896